MIGLSWSCAHPDGKGGRSSDKHIYQWRKGEFPKGKANGCYEKGEDLLSRQNNRHGLTVGFKTYHISYKEITEPSYLLGLPKFLKVFPLQVSVNSF